MAPVSSGTFRISPALANGDRDTGTIIVLDPAPTYPDYGERLRFTLHETEGRTIKQRSATNPKEKMLVWTGYTPNTPKYEDQYWTLFELQEHIRDAVKSTSPYVYIKENITGQWGFYSSGTGKLVSDWLRCRILNVSRTITKDGGQVKFPETKVTFTIDEPNKTVY